MVDNYLNIVYTGPMMRKELMMDEEQINAICKEIATETFTEYAEEYANDLDYEWLKEMELANPRFFGPDFDEKF
jgi:hypothetical protein